MSVGVRFVDTACQLCKICRYTKSVWQCFDADPDPGSALEKTDPDPKQRIFQFLFELFYAKTWINQIFLIVQIWVWE